MSRTRLLGLRAEGRCGLALVVTLGLAAAAPAPAQTIGFTDVTAEAGIDALHTAVSGTAFTPGVAVGDFNNDGWQDLFVLRGYAASNQLYLNDGDGTFTEVSADWGVDEVFAGSGFAVGDYDNDGWLDVYLTNLGTVPGLVGQHRLYHNDGGTGFTDVAAAMNVQTEAIPASSFGVTWGDIDLDGDLDLFKTGWTGWGSLGNRLYRNDGTTFTEITFTHLVTGFGQTQGYTPQLVDMDFDRDPDLLLVADFGTSIFFENTGGGFFVDETVGSGTSLETNGMGSCVADFDGDGILDWYTTSIWREGAGDPGTGNMLYKGLGNLQFQEIGQAAGVHDGGWGWGAAAVDVDHDGLQDIIENNGWHRDGQTEFFFEQVYLFHNDGNMQFTEMAVAAGLDYAVDGRGVVRFDYDNDGDQDLVFSGTEFPLKLFRNDLTGPDIHWLRVFLDNDGRSDIAPNGYGAFIYADAGGVRQMRAMEGGGSYLSANELSAHYGLGASATVDRLIVRWPDGHVQTLSDLPADATYTVVCCGPWEDIGFELAGAQGAPELLGEGELAGNDPIELHLLNVPASTTAWMVLGLAQANYAFYGGTLVPTLDPPALQLPLPTSPAGALSVGGLWPTGVPAGLEIFFQYWVVDATGPFGFTASNALKATTP